MKMDMVNIKIHFINTNTTVVLSSEANVDMEMDILYLNKIILAYLAILSRHANHLTTKNRVVKYIFPLTELETIVYYIIIFISLSLYS
jgi:hypothetical protein